MLLLQFINIKKDPAKITGGTISLGQDKSNDVVINEPGVSDFHAEISIDENRITLSDLLSENGTYVNGNRISRNKELFPWDRIKLASIEMEISESEKYRPGDWALKKESDLLNSQYIPLDVMTTVGRNEDCDLVILDGLLSRKHAVLTIINDHLLVEDLNSANGTYINNQRIEKSNAVPGDEITFDKISFELLGPSCANSLSEPEDSTIFREDQDEDRTQLYTSETLDSSNSLAHIGDHQLDDSTSLLESSDLDKTQLYQTENTHSAEQTVLLPTPENSEKTELYEPQTQENRIGYRSSGWLWAGLGFILTILVGLVIYLSLK